MRNQLTYPQASPLLPPPSSWPELSPQLPSSPGVYWFLDQKKTVLYIGKAKNLRKRVISYSRAYLPGRIKEMVSLAKFTRFQETESEFICLLLEADLIRLYQPKFNIRLKDDKSNLYIGITKSSTIPKIVTLRKNELNNPEVPLKKIYGPFTSQKITRSILNIARHIVPFCGSTELPTKSKRPCFYFHLNLCPGICTQKINAIQYNRQIRQLILFLSGKHTKLIHELLSGINRLIKLEQYESANILKKQVQTLQSLNKVSPSSLSSDLFFS